MEWNLYLLPPFFSLYVAYSRWLMSAIFPFSGVKVAASGFYQ